MTGGKNRQRPGYTIIEVMIFLAISGVMFVMAAGFISGKQAQVEFRQSMNDINTALNDVINQVSNGEDFAYSKLTCQGNATGPQISNNPMSNLDQGENLGCIFLGKVLQFNVSGDPTKYDIYTVAANQLDSSGSAVTNFADAFPVAIDSNCSANCHSTVNLTQSSVLTQGLELTHIIACQTSCPTSPPYPAEQGAIGFFGSFSNGFSDSSQSGAQSVTTAIIPGTPITIPAGSSEASMVDALNTKMHTMTAANYVGSGSSVLNSFILLCFKSGTRIGSITIGGGQGQQLSTDEELGNGIPNVCYS